MQLGDRADGSLRLGTASLYDTCFVLVNARIKHDALISVLSVVSCIAYDYPVSLETSLPIALYLPMLMSEWLNDAIDPAQCIQNVRCIGYVPSGIKFYSESKHSRTSLKC